MIYMRQKLDFLPFLLTAVLFLLIGYILGGNQEIHNTEYRYSTDEVAPFPRQLTAPSTFSSALVAKLAECTLKRMKDEKPEQSDPELIQFARDNLLIAPNPDLPYNLSNTFQFSDQSQYQQVPIVGDIFTKVIKSSSDPGSSSSSGGFFIEAGAFDGETLSNTLWFERNWGWTGLLIESDKKSFAQLQSKNRKAWLAKICLSPTKYPGKQTFYENLDADHPMGAGLHKIAFNGDKRATTMYCAPLYTLLAALNQTVVDFFSLDIEGAELDILETIPFDKIHFKVLTIETEWVPGGNGASRVKALLNRHGYKLYTMSAQEFDSIYVNQAYLPSDFKEYESTRVNLTL